MKRILIIISLSLCSMLLATDFQMIKLTDVPTAGLLQKGEYNIFSKIYQDNGLVLGANVGLLPRLMFGFSYGGEKVVGNQKPKWHDNPEFLVKVRVLDESEKYPALVIGYDSMGHGKFYSGSYQDGDKVINYKRYDMKSKGFYIVASKNYSFLGSLGLHIGTNLSREDDGDDDINFFAGIDKTIGQMITFVGEYDLAINDSDNKFNEELFGQGKGYLNASVNIKFSDSLILKISAYDLLENGKNTIGMDRSITINYFSKY